MAVLAQLATRSTRAAVCQVGPGRTVKMVRQLRTENMQSIIRKYIPLSCEIISQISCKIKLTLNQNVILNTNLSTKAHVKYIIINEIEIQICHVHLYM